MNEEAGDVGRRVKRGEGRLTVMVLGLRCYLRYQVYVCGDCACSIATVLIYMHSHRPYYSCLAVLYAAGLASCQQKLRRWHGNAPFSSRLSRDWRCHA